MANRLSDLLAKKAELEKEISEAQREERSAAIAQVKSLMAQHGLTLADLGTRTTTHTSVRSGTKVAPKYRDPATGQTWSGRGLQPKWLKQALNAGAKLTDFAL